jgi:DNA modification methylase
LWLLGEHRLLCGDSTKPEDVSRLTAGQEIGVVHADPPYGMNVNTHFDGMFRADPTHRKTGARFDAVIGDETTEIAIAAMRTTPECASQFWWGADYYRRGLPDGGGWFVWDKRWNDAGMDLDSVAGNCFELCWSKHAHKRRVFRITWSGHHGMQKSDTKSRVHPNQKPVQLVAELLALVGGIIYDPFLGSGTTLIASEQLGRRCYGMEISPQYCDVIVKRWETLTGKKAELESNRV